jgi:hypothetical protein
MASPTGLSAYARNTLEGSIRLKWTPVDGARVYRVTRVRNTGDPETTITEAPVSEFVTWQGWLDYYGGSCDPLDVAVIPEQAYCEYMDSDMTPGTTYSYRVYALFSNSVISPPSATVTAKTLKR